MIGLALRILVFGALWFVVVWCLFGAWAWVERELFWKSLGGRR